MHTNSDTIFRLFHMAWSNLFIVLALKTLKWKFLIGCWRISTNEKMVSQPTTSKIWITPYEKAWKIMLTNGVQLVCIFWSHLCLADVKSILFYSEALELWMANAFEQWEDRKQFLRGKRLKGSCPKAISFTKRKRASKLPFLTF